MKINLFLLLVFLATAFNSNAQTPKNCSQILALNPMSASGLYNIDPDGGGVLPSMKCYCDMTTDGGGWTLILNYNHLTATSPALNIFTDSLPLQGAITLGIDESNTEFWGHADTALVNAIPFDEIRFYGITSGHDRIIHFKTFHSGTVSYFKTGKGSTQGISSAFSPLANHSAFLPAAIDLSTTDKGNYAMTDYPLWTGSTYHWYLGGTDSQICTIRWEVDDYPCSYIPSTFHQIWVRQSNITEMNDAVGSQMPLNLYPNPASEMATVNFKEGNNTVYALSIYNNTGQLIRSESMYNNQHQINVADLSNGLYLIVITSNKGVQHQKLVISR